MQVEVLIPTMNAENPIELLDNMNIQTDAVICNQCSHFGYRQINYNNRQIDFYSFKEKGVGLNRNNGLMRSKGDYCVIADDDLIFKDNYEKIVCNNFEENRDADVLIFNIIEDIPTRYIVKQKFRVSYKNYMRFGAVRIVVKRKSIIKSNIFFNLNFGGGTKYSAGEDTLFLHDCLKKGLKIIAVPDSIARLSNARPSTWFCGYNEKYFKDRGALYTAIYPNLSRIMCLQFLLRHKKMYKDEVPIKEAYEFMKKGIEEYKKW